MKLTLKVCLTLAAVLSIIGLTACKCPPQRGQIATKGKLKIIVQPEDQIVPVGGDATFVVVAEPLPLTYQWRRNGIDLPGQTNATLTLPAVTFTNAGIYTCLVKKNPELETVPAELTVFSTTAPVQTTGVFQSSSKSKSCIGNYHGYAKFKTATGSTWWTPPAGKTSCTITDASNYTTKVEAIEYPTLPPNWCGSETFTFPVTQGRQYAFTTYVVTTPVPAVNEVLLLTINWQP